MKIRPWVFPLATLLCGASVLHATILNPSDCVGDNIPSCPGFLEAFTGSPGSFLTGSTQTFLDPNFNLTLAAAVFRNPNGSTLDFYYQLRVNNPSSLGLEFAGVSVRADFVVDAGLRKDAVGAFGSGLDAVTFAAADGNADHLLRDAAFVILNFDSGTPAVPLPVLPGQTAPTLVLKTNATKYTRGDLQAISANVSGGTTSISYNVVFPVLQPATSVPEPATALYLGPLLALCLALSRLRYRTSYPGSGSGIAGQAKRSLT